MCVFERDCPLFINAIKETECRSRSARSALSSAPMGPYSKIIPNMCLYVCLSSVNKTKTGGSFEKTDESERE